MEAGLLTESPAALPSLEDGIGWGCKFQASHHGLVFLVTNQEPAKSLLIRIKDAPISHEISSYLGALW